MPRDSNGTYSLPAGNPVATLSVISSTWANTTLSDISTALTGSLDRSGQGAMLAGLKLFDGTLGAPGLTWGTETTSGFYRAGAADYRFAIGGADVWRVGNTGQIGRFASGTVAAPGISWFQESTAGFYRAGAGDFRWAMSGVDFLQWTNNLIHYTGSAPAFRFNEFDAAANNRLWDMVVSGEDMVFRVLTDALAPTAWMTVTRTAGVVDAVTLAATAIAVQGTFSSNGTSTFTKSRGVAGEWGVYVNSNDPFYGIREADAAANNRLWSIGASAEQFRISLLDDAESTSNPFFTVDRTGTTIDTVNFPNGTLQYGGIEVGYKGFPQNSENTNFNIGNTYAGVITYYTSSGHTATIQATFTALTGGTTTIANHGTGNLTIATASGTLQWLNGSGAVSTGSRTLAVGGIATISVRNGTGNPYIWGTGLS